MNPNADNTHSWRCLFFSPQKNLWKKKFHLQKEQEDQKGEIPLRTMTVLNMGKAHAWFQATGWFIRFMLGGGKGVPPNAWWSSDVLPVKHCLFKAVIRSDRWLVWNALTKANILINKHFFFFFFLILIEAMWRLNKQDTSQRCLRNNGHHRRS